MDELEISGKRYLSSKRAAREHKYHADYIGQLIRAGKVVGTKVGRAWYVEATSLDEYLASEAHTTSTTTSVAPSMPQKQPETIFTIPVKKELPHIRVEEVEAPAAPKTHTLRYIADESPVFPVIQKTSHIFDTSHVAHTTPKTLSHVMPRTPYITPKRKHPSFLRVAAVLVVLGGLTFAGVLFTSAKVLSIVTVEQGKAAAARFSLE